MFYFFIENFLVMKKKLISFIVFSFLLTPLLHAAQAHTLAYYEQTDHDKNSFVIDLTGELIHLLATTKTVLDYSYFPEENKSDSESIANLSQAWSVMGSLLEESKESFIHKSKEEIQSSLAKVRRENKFTESSPVHLLFNVSEPEELTLQEVEKTFNELTECYKKSGQEDPSDSDSHKLLCEKMALINSAFAQKQIAPLKNHEELIKLARQSWFFFGQPLGIARYTAFCKDYSNHDPEYTHLTLLQTEFKKTCATLLLSVDDCILCSQALRFAKLPKEDTDHLIHHAIGLINEKLLIHKAELPWLLHKALELTATLTNFFAPSDTDE